MQTVKLCIFLLIFHTEAYAQQARIFGQDFQAAQHPLFSTKDAALYARSNSALGTLDYTYGSDLAPIVRLLSSKKFSVYRVHLIDGTCIHNRNCAPDYPFQNYTTESFEAAVKANDPIITNFLENRTKLYCPLMLTQQPVFIRISPVMEHRLTNRAFRMLADIVLGACPGVSLVNNPASGTGEEYRGAMLESHDGFKNPKAIVSLYGTEATDADIPAWSSATKNSTVAFVWSRVFNCNNNGPFTYPKDRTSCPKARDFELLSHITDDRGKAPKPSFSCKFEAFKSPMIWKPFAEDFGTPDSRANLPVAITPLGNRNIELVGALGKSAGYLRYYGSYQGGLNRHYSGTGSRLSGYEIEKKAATLNKGIPFVWLKQSNRCIGPIVAGRRNGKMR
jgi:hypothetical protein